MTIKKEDKKDDKKDEAPGYGFWIRGSSHWEATLGGNAGRQREATGGLRILGPREHSPTRTKRDIGPLQQRLFRELAYCAYRIQKATQTKMSSALPGGLPLEIQKLSSRNDPGGGGWMGGGPN